MAILELTGQYRIVVEVKRGGKMKTACCETGLVASQFAKYDVWISDYEPRSLVFTKCRGAALRKPATIDQGSLFTPMRIISRKALRTFSTKYPDALIPLEAWYRVSKQAIWRSFADIRAIYGSADPVGRFTVFNVGGNKYRLIVVIHFDKGRLYIRHVLTHSEYHKGAWKTD